MKSQIFDQIEARLRAKVPELVTIDLYDNQLQRQNSEDNDEDPTICPAVLVEFPETGYATLGKGEQNAAPAIVLHLGLDSYSTLRQDLLAQELFEGKIQAALQGWSPEETSTFTRRRSYTVAKYGPQSEYALEYGCIYKDTAGGKQFIKIPPPPASIAATI